jgi:membrane-associated phospholipid phosphatase
LILLLLVCLCFAESAGAQADWQSPDADTSLLHFPVKLVDDIPHLFISENIAPFTIGSVATALDWTLLDNQNDLAADLQKWNSPSLFNFGDFYGEGWVEGIGALGSWGAGALWSNPKLQEFGRDMAESLVSSTILVTGLKYAVERERPDKSNNLSFPSGHAITAFCVAPVISQYWGWEAGIPAYLLGTITGLSRVEGYHHYLSDVIAGATFGIIIGNAVVYTPKNVSVGVGPGQMELKLAFN